MMVVLFLMGRYPSLSRSRFPHEESNLAVALNAHFGLDQLSAPKQDKPRADGTTIAALLWMNAAMLHQRIHAGGWLGLVKRRIGGVVFGCFRRATFGV